MEAGKVPPRSPGSGCAFRRGPTDLRFAHHIVHASHGQCFIKARMERLKENIWGTRASIIGHPWNLAPFKTQNGYIDGPHERLAEIALLKRQSA
jgi:hypothetical protein